MSKSAIKSLNTANEILAALDLTIGNPASWMSNEQARGQFKNADLLACLIIDSAANALICENADTLEENMFNDMQEAVESYIEANLCDWTQAEWKNNAELCDVAALLAKLLAAVDGQRAYDARQKAHAEALEMNAQFDSVEYPTVTAECYHEARVMNRYIGNADLIPSSGFCQADKDYLLGVNARLRPDLLAYDIRTAHEEALDINAKFDALTAIARVAAECRDAGLNEEATIAVVNGAMSLEEALGGMDMDAEVEAMEYDEQDWADDSDSCTFDEFLAGGEADARYAAERREAEDFYD